MMGRLRSQNSLKSYNVWPLPFFFPTCTNLAYRHCPSGVVTSEPGGGLNSNVDGETGVRDWLE
jgi:hypothetical protein